MPVNEHCKSGDPPFRNMSTPASSFNGEDRHLDDTWTTLGRHLDLDFLDLDFLDLDFLDLDSWTWTLGLGLLDLDSWTWTLGLGLGLGLGWKQFQW